jgi:hypothetical protein
MSYTVVITNATGKEPDGTPIVSTPDVQGNVTDNSTGEPAANALVRITEPLINDEAQGYTDDNGNFDIRVGEDTMHPIFVNGELSARVKIRMA